MNHASPPAFLSQPRYRPVQRPVDLEDAKSTTVPPDLGEAAGRERIRPGPRITVRGSSAAITARRAENLSPPASTPTTRPASTTI
jgi:hypothetical protein